MKPALTCQQAQQMILAADSVEREMANSAALAEHVQACAECRSLGERLSRLESVVRDLPMAPGSRKPSEAFLERVRAMPARELGVAGRIGGGAFWGRRVAAAAILLIAVLAGLTLCLSTSSAARGATVRDALVEWNAQLNQSHDGAARNQIYARSVGALKRQVAQASLNASDRVLAESLLDNAAWLTTQSDPLEEARRLAAIADLLAARQRAVSRAGTDANYGRMYQRVAGTIAADLQRVDAAQLTPAQHEHWEELRRYLPPASMPGSTTFPTTDRAADRAMMELPGATLAAVRSKADGGTLLNGGPQAIAGSGGAWITPVNGRGTTENRPPMAMSPKEPRLALPPEAPGGGMQGGGELVKGEPGNGGPPVAGLGGRPGMPRYPVRLMEGDMGGPGGREHGGVAAGFAEWPPPMGFSGGGWATLAWPVEGAPAAARTMAPDGGMALPAWGRLVNPPTAWLTAEGLDAASYAAVTEPSAQAPVWKDMETFEALAVGPGLPEKSILEELVNQGLGLDKAITAGDWSMGMDDSAWAFAADYWKYDAEAGMPVMDLSGAFAFGATPAPEPGTVGLVMVGGAIWLVGGGRRGRRR